MKKFYILDGSGYLYRAYHALPPMVNEEGVNINMIYGFFRMIFRLIIEKPDYFVITWDSPVKTIRHEIFEQYKANRPKKPDDFKWQERKIKELVGEIDFKFLEIPTYEADDIIYTLVKNFKENDISIYIESMDKDLKQILTDNVYFYNSSKGEIVDLSMFERQFGFKASNIVDYLSILGDASDNIPGAKGIGQKGATELIQKYGDIDTIYENIDEIQGSIKDKLIESKDQVYKSKELIKLIETPGIDGIDLEEYKYNVDIALYKKVLIEQCKFKSMDKILNELKKKFEGGEQLSLFG